MVRLTKDETSVNMSPQSCGGERFLFFLFSERSSLCDEMLRSWVVLKVVRDVGRADSCYL